MLRANVGLSRKLSKDFNSTGFSVNLDGEISAPTSDAEAVIERVKELFDLAEEALDLQLARSRSVDAMAARDAEPVEPPAREAHVGERGESRRSAPQSEPDRDRDGREPEPATNKQIQFLLNLGQKQRLSRRELQGRISDILGRTCGVYDLSKRDAGIVLDSLTGGNGNRRPQNTAR